MSFTPTEQRMLDVLSDGLRHTRQELHACLEDDLCVLSRIQIHISNIRGKIRPIGQDILCEFHLRSYWYRHVRLLASPYRP